MSGNRFHQYVKQAHLSTPEKLEKLEQQLVADAKKPTNEREINSTDLGDSYMFFPTKITPLQLAIQSCGAGVSPKLREIILLYFTYSDCTVEGDYGSTLQYASMYDQCGEDIIRIISDRNPELVKRLSPQGHFPLHSAACYDSTGKSIKALLDAKADINARSKNEGWTALHQASYINNSVAAEVLLRNNADKNAVDKNFNTPARLSHYWSRSSAGKRTLEDQNHADVTKLIREFKLG
jgi:hypothetical protein